MTPFERLLGRLFGGAVAPAQFVQQEQRARQAVAALAGTVGQGVVQGASMVDRLLGVPLVEAGTDTVMNGVLQRMAQAQEQSGLAGTGPQLGRALAPTAQQAVSGIGRPAMGHALAKTLPGVAMKVINGASGAALRGNKPLAPNPLQDQLDQLVLQVKAAAAAQQAWQQRAARAGLAQAFLTPLQMGAAAMSAALTTPGLASVLGPRLGQAVAGLPAIAAAPRGQRRAMQPAANQAADQPANQGPVDALIGAFQPVLPLLRATLDRITGHSTAAPRRAGQAASTPAQQRRHAGIGAAAALLPQLATPFVQAGQAVVTALQATAPVAPLAAALPGALAQGLRGLAARAQQQAPQPAAQQAPAAPPPVPINARQPGATGDDEALTQQLTRVLKREAARDGIDISDVQP